MTWENDHHEPARCEICRSRSFVIFVKAAGQYLCEDHETEFFAKQEEEDARPLPSGSTQ